MATATLHPTPAHKPEPTFSDSPSSVQSPDSSSKNDPSYIPRGPVTANLEFYSPPTDGSAPFNYVEAPPEGQPQRNFSAVSIPVPLTDIRGSESAYTLDANAFATVSSAPSATSAATFTSDASIRSTYYPEVEALLLAEVPGATRILLFDHTIRRADPSAPRAPVTRVHIDQTPASAEARVRHHLPSEADALLRRRYRIINVWRPLNGPVQSMPLAFADASKVRDEDLVGIQHRYPDRTGETAGVKWEGGQKWCYWSGMGNGERLLLKCYDSDEVVGGWGRVPHTAFVDPRTPGGARGRESIEVRALVFD